MQTSTILQYKTKPIFSPDGQFIAYCLNYFVYIKQAKVNLQNVAQIPYPKGQRLPTILFSPDSQYVAIFNQNLDSIQVFDVYGNIKARIKDSFDSKIQTVTWTPDSCQILTFNNIKCKIYNLQTKSQVQIVNVKTSKEHNFFSFNKGEQPGLLMAILEKHNTKDYLGVYSTLDWKLLYHIKLETFDAVSLEFTIYGDIMIFDNKLNFKVLFIPLNNKKQGVYAPKDYCLGVYNYSFSKSGNFLALSAGDNQIHLLNTLTWKPITTFSLPNELNTQRTTILKQDDQNFFREIQTTFTKLSKETQIKKIQKNQYNHNFDKLIFSPDDNYLATRSFYTPNVVFVWSIKNLELAYVIIFKNHKVEDYCWLKQESKLCIVNGRSAFYIFQHDTRDVVQYCVQKGTTKAISIKKIQTQKEENLEKVLLSGGQNFCYNEFLSVQHGGY